MIDTRFFDAYYEINVLQESQVRLYPSLCTNWGQVSPAPFHQWTINVYEGVGQ